MRRVGTIKEIWRYPVKGMGGERIESCELGELGLDRDRRWALRDIARDEIQSCKFRPQLLLCTASAQHDADGGVAIEFPDGQKLSVRDERVDEHLSNLVGHPSCLEPLVAQASADRYRRFHGGKGGWLGELKATFDRLDGEPLPDFDNLPPSVAEYVTLPDTFFLVAPIHVVTTATLHQMRTLRPGSNWDTRRFRANLVVETLPGVAAFSEQRWVGSTLALGDARMECTGPTPRCGAIARSQRDFGADTGVLRTVVNQAEQNLGIYAKATSQSALREGDEVWLV